MSYLASSPINADRTKARASSDSCIQLCPIGSPRIVSLNIIGVSGRANSEQRYGLILLAATAMRLTNVETSSFRAGSLISAKARSGATH